MGTSSNNALLISRYREYIEHATTQKSNAAHNRFRDNPFIYNFAVLLKGIKEGYIIRNNPSSAKTIELMCRSRELPSPLSSTMLTIYGRTNKTIVNNFLNPSKITTDAKRNAVNNAVSIDDICEYIYLAYQKKRKYESDSTLEDLVDVMNLTGASINDIFWTSDEYSRRSVPVYIPASIIPVLDSLNTEITFPAFSIPAYGISFYLKISPRKNQILNSQQSKNIFNLFCVDPAGVLESFLHEDLMEIKDRHSISAIQEWYEEWLFDFTGEAPSYFYKDKFRSIQGMPAFSQTRWYKEWELYQRETSTLTQKRLRENQYLLNRYDEIPNTEPNRKPSLDERLG